MAVATLPRLERAISGCMDLGLRDRRVLVTGATAGIGHAAARLFAAEGALVVVNGGTDSRVGAAVDSIPGSSPDAQVQGVAADLGTAAGADAMVRAAPAVDVLVDNM